MLAKSVDSVNDEPLFPGPDRYLSDCETSLSTRRSSRELIHNVSGVLIKIDQLKGSKLCYVFIQCMPHTPSSGQPLLPINPEPQRIGRMEAQHEIERMVALPEQARLAALAAAQVHQQNIDNPARATNPDDEDLDNDELLNPRHDAKIITPSNRRDHQARFRHER
ncbi:hypothetical protein CQW23_29787 [Capsicum baccatum]|uniref:Uncharacterized protein n=1 Tax=Capsicum baccatum TaxID=33114 RepID=A0A2G2VCB4_CAPBA|nr:hypothetical protein CQW23_29787 [Capsicum baccatum]